MIDPEIQFPDTPFDLRKALIVLMRRGSEAHGTWIPPEEKDGVDDRDLMGVVVPPREYYTGLSKWEQTSSIKDVWDVVLYEFRKFIRLLIKQNPNVVSMLWLEPKDYLFRTPEWDLLLENRELFRDKDAFYFSVKGYAEGQLKRMTNPNDGGFMGAKRRALYERFGYDCKNAAHLIRLLSTGVEYLNDGKMQVKRTWDRDNIIDIKKGEYSLDDINFQAGSLFEQLKTAHEHSSMPNKVDEQAINALTMRIVERRLYGCEFSYSG